MRASLAASTVTPGSTAPDESFTTPAIDACARAVVGIAKRHVRNAIARADLHISRLPSTAVTEATPPYMPVAGGGQQCEPDGGKGREGRKGRTGRTGRTVRTLRTP